MDIALAVEKIYTAALFRRSDTYVNLVATWKDARRVPSEAQLAEAWLIVLADRDIASAEQAEKDTQLTLLADVVEREKLTPAEQLTLAMDVLVSVANGETFTRNETF
jgi:hypothetical protein